MLPLRWAALIAPVLLLPTCRARAQPTPKLERVSIEDGSGAARWSAAEATVTTSTRFAQRGGTSLQFHVLVDHFAGEPNYPVGWPRINLELPAELQDWSRYDFLELVIHTETSRAALPPTPLGFIAHTPDRAHEYDRALTEVRKGATVTIAVPLAKIPRHSLVPLIQFFVSESDYRHGDVVDFTIDDIALTRYAEPGLSGLAPLESVAFDDTTHLGARFQLLGVEPGKTARVTARLTQAGRMVGEGQWNLPRGEHEVWLALKQPPKVGPADLALYLGGLQGVARLRVVPSPYAGGGK